MNFKAIAVGLNCILMPLGISAQGYFEITPDIETAYRDALALRFEDAKVGLSKIKANDPENLMVHLVENYIDFFTVFISEEEGLLDALNPNKQRRLDLVSKGDSKSPYYRFVQAEIHLQWALARSKFLKSTSGIRAFDMSILNDANRAYYLLETNAQLFPEFIANNKSLGVMHALAGYLPKFVRFLFNVKGSLEQGKEEIEALIHYGQKQGFLFQQEVYVIYAYMMMDLYNDSETAWQVLSDLNLDYSENQLARFVMASLAQKTGRNDELIKILEQKIKKEEFFEFHYLDYLLGKAYLRKLDPRSKEHIEYFLNNFKGRHFIKEGYQKLAWYYLIIEEDAQKYMTTIELGKTRGYELLEDDQQALKEAKKGATPQPDLLKARLLYDGGYYDQALALLQKKKDRLSNNKKTNIEYYYRLGRIQQELKKYDAAKSAFKEVIRLSGRKKRFFACNAALQLGLIFEYFNNYDYAVTYFELCKKIKSDKYRKHLHNKAKAGLERIKSKD